MLKILAIAVLMFGATASSAFAQAKIFLASTGNDANDGGRATPKRSLQAAHDAVFTNGEIVILDTAGYGAVTITKGLGIVVPPGVSGFVTVTTADGNGVTINAGASDIVTLRGLIIEGPGLSGSAKGVYVQSVGTLVVEDTTIRNFYDGIVVDSAANTKLVVRGGAIRNTYYGILINDHAPNNAAIGLVTDTELTANYISLSARQIYSGSTPHLVATRCAISGSLFYSFYVTGAGADAVADGCTIAGNAKVFTVDSGGTIFTRGNNTVYSNTSPGNATPVVLPAQ